MPTVLTQRFADALQVAADLHENGEGDGPPHTSHLLQVAGMVLEAGGDEDQAIAALFHDALETASGDEDVEARESRIRDSFGDRPADIVVACTDPSPNGDDDGWKEVKEQYIHHLWTVADDATVRVSAADKLSTARGIIQDYRAHGEAAWARYEGGRSGTLWYYRALVGAYRYRGVNGHVDELEHIVHTLEEETDLA
jgi:GTP pyrophosphokinase